MSKPPNSHIATTLSGFNRVAAERGEGLHPLLLAALTKFGSVSGPPPLSGQSDENVIRVDFSDNTTTRTHSKATPR